MNLNDLQQELKFTTSKSGGSGGQHVNKVETKVTLYFDIDKSKILSQNEKLLLQEKLSNRINNEGILILSQDRNRSQLKNKQAVVAKFLNLIQKALKPRKKRKRTKPPTVAIEDRKRDKKHRAKIKEMRKKPKL